MIPGTGPGCDSQFFFHVSDVLVAGAIGEIYVSYDFYRICVLIITGAMVAREPIRVPLRKLGSDLHRGLFSRRRYYIYLDTYIPIKVYINRGISIRNHCGAEPPRDPQPAGLIGTVGRRDRTPTSDVAAYRVKASARPARGWIRGIHGGRTTTPLPAEAWAISGVR